MENQSSMSSGKPSLTCVLCGVADGRPTSTLYQKGFQGLIDASKCRGEQLHIEIGQAVHVDCRKRYCRNSTTPQKENKIPTTPQSTRKSQDAFDFPTTCLFCGKDAKYKNNKRGFDVQPVRVRTLEFQESLKVVCKRRDDEWSRKVLGRLEYVCDLPAAEAVYHQTCCSNFRSGCQMPKQWADGNQCNMKRGRPVCMSAENAFKEVIEYFESSESQQVTVGNMVDRMKELCGDDAYSNVYMKKRILDCFGDNIIVTELNGKANVVTFKSNAHAILNTFYKREGERDAATEKVAIIKTAGKLILDDIRSKTSSKDNYPSSTSILSTEENLECVPKSLQLLLGQVIDSKNCDKLITALGQAIVQATMPRSFIAPLQIGLGIQLHHQFASRILIETLHSLGFCSSYQEVKKFEAAAATTQNHYIQKSEQQFMQFVADNVDHNVATLDGHGTFHGMGAIATLTPQCNLVRVIPRITVTSEDLIEAGNIKIHYYKKATTPMEMMIFKELISVGNTDDIFLNPVEFLLKVGRPLRPSTPSWSGVMQAFRTGQHPGMSTVVFLPMIDMNPSDMSCIYSTLKFICDQAMSLCCTPIVTFDQPLYWKATTIISNESEDMNLKRTLIRLGPFHTEMSFLGCVGKLMDNSGLSTLLNTVYAPNTVGHMLSGKAVSRAVRGHFITCDALEKLLVFKAFPDVYSEQTVDASPVDSETHDQATEANDMQQPIEETNTDEDNTQIEDVSAVDSETQDQATEASDVQQSVEENHTHECSTSQHLCSLFDKVFDGSCSESELCLDSTIQLMQQRYLDIKHSLLEDNRTASLWLLYMEMIDILKFFIASERTGDWISHLKSIQLMLPFFAAAGHNLYLKSSYVYLQQMLNLPDTHPDVYAAFCKGHHVIRRSERYWAGLSSDLVIEQVLMRSVKAVGGMTRGRGMKDAQRAQWILAMPACSEVNAAMQEFTGQTYQSSDQHKDAACSRVEKDAKDRQTVLEYLQERNPFNEVLTDLRNIETGVIADAKVDVDKAKEIGEAIVKDMKNKPVATMVFRRCKQTTTMGAKSNLKVNDEEIHVDPQLLFQRLVTVSDYTSTDLEDIFKYELCSNPSSLFDSSGVMREASKSQLAHAIWDLGECGADNLPLDAVPVLDGGSLLHRIPWEYGKSFGEICEHYLRHITANYKSAHVVFDGYSSGPSTKDTAHMRRSKGNIGARTIFDRKTPLKMKKETFLNNLNNKQEFIFMLGSMLASHDVVIHFSEGDADCDIVDTALELAKTNPTVVVGEDTDLLVLMCNHADRESHPVYFQTGSLKQNKIWNIHKTMDVLGQKVCATLPVLHAFSGCDTVSRTFGVGKAVLLKKALKDDFVNRCAEVFLNDATHEEVKIAGEQLLTCMYNGKQSDGLDKQRHIKFVQKVSKSRSTVQVQSLPPTASAAEYHSYRTYHQVQTWVHKPCSALEWGWLLQDFTYIPRKCALPPAPEQLLKMVRCSCKTNCDTKRCSCKRHGLKCSTACRECVGISCSNTDTLQQHEDIDEIVSQILADES